MISWLFLFLLWPRSLFAASPEEISLEAYSRVGEIWSLHLMLQSGGACQLEGFTVGVKEAKLKTLSLDECRNLKNDVQEVANEVAEKKVLLKKPSHLFTSDEPNYKFGYGHVDFYVNLQAPTVCELDPDGQPHCTQNDLSSAQLLLIEMRRYAKALGLGSQW